MPLLRDIYSATDRVLARTPAVCRDPLLRLIAPLVESITCPRVLMVEPTNACNGKCPLCAVGAGTLSRSLGMLAPATLATVMEEVGSRVQLVIMNFAGEPFLHPELPDLIRLSGSHGAQVIVGTNGTRDRADEILDAQPSEILFALDGSTPDSYAQYRSYRDKTTFEEVKENLERLVERKRSKGSPTQIILQFVVFKHNEHEAQKILEYAARVRVDAVDFKPACVNDYFEEDVDLLKDRFLPITSSVRQYRKNGDRKSLLGRGFCSFAFNESQLAWNGDMISCCYDADGSNVLGNVVENGGLLAVWSGSRGRAMRRAILRQKLALCEKCGASRVRSKRVPVK
jgi:pyruvate-formate lyase-activating enzyme